MNKIKNNFYTLIFFISVAASVISSCNTSSSPQKNVTFAKDIAPIIFKNCSPCHQKNSVGPFPLLSFTDVAKVTFF